MLAFASVLAGAVYTGGVYASLCVRVAKFDQTMRRFSGQ